MLGINPFDHPYGYGHGFGGGYERRPPPTRRPPEAPAAEPHFKTSTTADAYTITVSAPEGHTLDGPRASLLSSREMEIVGVLQPSTTSCEFLTLGRTAVYARPSGRQLLGVVPPRTVVSGEPYKHGWVALDNDEGWVQAADLQSLSSRAAAPRRFSERVDIPADALPRHATSHVLESGSLQITVPRRQRAARHETARAAPTRRVAPQSPPSRPTASPTASTPPVKPAAPTPAAPKPAARTAKRTASSNAPVGGQGLPASADGPVLMEVAASDCNVQRPPETTQHWHASACGGFVTSEAMRDVAAAAMRPGGGTDDKELEFYGF